MEYKDAEKIARNLLKIHTSNHGLLKQYARIHKLNYTSVVNLRNNKIPKNKAYPKLVCKILLTFGYKATFKPKYEFKLIAPKNDKTKNL
jgi:hypothetical protein